MIPKRKRREAERLRHVVDCLPFDTRVAMLDGLRRYDRIIVGAYSDRSGGVCPMLAAHRCGGRTDFRSFARAWDRFTGAGRRARRATERELRTLTAQIEASIWAEEEMRAEVSDLSSRPSSAESARESIPKLGQGGAWLRPVRRWDGYREAVTAALRQLHGREPSSKDEAEEREDELARS
jgi:hypothetical protein